MTGSTFDGSLFEGWVWHFSFDVLGFGGYRLEEESRVEAEGSHS